MADQCKANEGKLIISINKALNREKSKFEQQISTAYNLKDLDYISRAK